MEEFVDGSALGDSTTYIRINDDGTAFWKLRNSIDEDWTEEESIGSSVDYENNADFASLNGAPNRLKS